MKKILAFMLVAILLLALAACGKKDDGDQTKTTNTTAPVGETKAPSQTKVYYKTDVAGSTITTVIVVPEEGETFPIKTAAPTEATTSTAAPTFTHAEDAPFNDVTLAW